ncbi:hypothetical protein NAPIS_ORF01194 [Vairimorpha apis BRL 01]|uniref:J domain-containing protein n=1 Tax=Vairimorpha apis BRL 01 TaxID=1037528 RepID=T0L9V1_9MICR|nr:hypothetical protein NAPIS_ORF01194 [Vairimorpha apis BRL 01]
MLPSNNYFKLFNLPVSYNIDKNKLKKNYYNLNMSYHTDVDNNERNMNMLINKGFKILNDDLLRAKYLNNEIVEMDKKFLLDILEIEEQIENAEDLNIIKDRLQKEIDLCKSKYYDKQYLCKWQYYDRLKKMVEKKLWKIILKISIDIEIFKFKKVVDKIL